MLFGVGFTLPTVIILWHECLQLTKIFPLLIGFLWGTAVCQLETDLCKYPVGRLRPHFFTVCKPMVFDEENFGVYNDTIFVSNYTCLGNSDLFPDPAERLHSIKEVSLSFPSGHASFAFQTATFTILYLQFIHRGLKQRYSSLNSLVIPFVQVICLCLATFTSVSRVMDYKHHPTDVLAGAVLGIVTQVLNVFGVMKLFSSATFGQVILDEEQPLQETVQVIDQAYGTDTATADKAV